MSSFCEKKVFSCDTGAEQTRDELRKQVYDAMAEQEATDAKSGDPKSPDEVKKENGVAGSPVKLINGSEKVSDAPVNGQEKSSVQQAAVNGAEKKTPEAPVNGGGESPAEAPGNESVTEKVQNGETPEAKLKDEESKAEAEEPEGSRPVDTEHCWCAWV